MTFAQIALINLGAIIAAMGGIFLKRLSESLTEIQFSVSGFLTIFSNLNLWLGGICYVLPIFIWAFLLRHMELTKLQPILSIVYVYTLGFAYLFLGEQPSAQRLIGIAVVIIGVILVGGS